MGRKNGMVSCHWTCRRKSPVTSRRADVFPHLQCFSNPLEYRQTETCLLSLWLFFPTLDLLWSNVYMAKEHLWNTIWTLFPISGVSEVNQNATALLEQLLHRFWGAWLWLSVSVCLSNSSLNCSNSKPVSLIKSSGLFSLAFGLLQRGVWKPSLHGKPGTVSALDAQLELCEAQQQTLWIQHSSCPYPLLDGSLWEHSEGLWD